MFNVPCNSQGHIGTGPQHSHLWGSNPHEVAVCYYMANLLATRPLRTCCSTYEMFVKNTCKNSWRLYLNPNLNIFMKDRAFGKKNIDYVSFAMFLIVLLSIIFERWVSDLDYSLIFWDFQLIYFCKVVLYLSLDFTILLSINIQYTSHMKFTRQ